jgi:MFS family permease
LKILAGWFSINNQQFLSMSIGPIALLRQATPAQRRTLLAAALGWMLDSFDAMLYALVLSHVMREFGMSKRTSGLLYTLTLLASGIGGVAFGFLADRIGRKRALMLSILTYSVCSFASGLSTGVVSLAIFRFILGLGMGGEWNTGATLVAETWPDESRAKAISIVQSSWAIGFALAALVSGIVLRYANWRAVFFVGILPAAITLWIQNRVPESAMWESQKQNLLPPRTQSAQRNATPGLHHETSGDSFLVIFRPPYLKSTITLLLLNFFGMFAWWGLFTWLPPYLSLPVEQGGRGFGVLGTTSLLVVLNLFGMFPGYASFGWIADRLGRRRSFILYTLSAAMLVPLYAMARSQTVLLLLGTVVAFFGTGFFSGSGIVGSEIFPTSVRARALGFTYNGARTMSSLAPFTIGWVGQIKGLSWAFYLCAGSFFLASVMATQLPETRGRSLE